MGESRICLCRIIYDQNIYYRKTALGVGPAHISQPPRKLAQTGNCRQLYSMWRQYQCCYKKLSSSCIISLTKILSNIQVTMTLYYDNHDLPTAWLLAQAIQAQTINLCLGLRRKRLEESKLLILKSLVDQHLKIVNFDSAKSLDFLNKSILYV